jgi:hypothetical protein
MPGKHEIAEAVMSLVGHLMELKEPVVIGGGEYVLPFFRELSAWAQSHDIDLSRGAEPHIVDFNQSE